MSVTAIRQWSYTIQRQHRLGDPNLFVHHRLRDSGRCIFQVAIPGKSSARHTSVHVINASRWSNLLCTAICYVRPFEKIFDNLSVQFVRASVGFTEYGQFHVSLSLRELLADRSPSRTHRLCRMLPGDVDTVVCWGQWLQLCCGMSVSKNAERLTRPDSSNKSVAVIRDRTRDLKIFSLTLSQLSYNSECRSMDNTEKLCHAYVQPHVRTQLQVRMQAKSTIPWTTSDKWQGSPCRSTLKYR